MQSAGRAPLADRWWLYKYTAIQSTSAARMPLAPTILDSSIAHLTTLASALAEEMASATDEQEALEARACKEILLSVSVLIPKLQAARHLIPLEDTLRRCTHCED